MNLLLMIANSMKHLSLVPDKVATTVDACTLVLYERHFRSKLALLRYPPSVETEVVSGVTQGVRYVPVD